MREEVSWFKNAVVYQIFLDRFAGVKNPSKSLEPEFCGGNIYSIISKIPYFKNLGVDTLWLSPIYEGTSYHGYHVTDFFNVDSRFGSIEDLSELIIKCHENDLKIILDFIPNHCSSRHPIFIKAKTNLKSRYRNWFYFNDKLNKLLNSDFEKDEDTYLSFLNFKDLPKLNLDYEPCRDYILSAARFWLDKGIDGFRLDHIAGPSFKFWKYFSSQINLTHPEAVLIGEMWPGGWKLKDFLTLKGVKNKLSRKILKPNDDVYLKDYQGILDGCLDFTFNKIMREYGSGNIGKDEAYKNLQKHYKRFEKDFFLPTFLDNHDMERILFTLNQDKEKLKELASWQFKIKQPRIIYYGTEIGMTQDESFSSRNSHGDLLARQVMRWQDEGNELYNFYRLLIAQKNRREHKNQ